AATVKVADSPTSTKVACDSPDMVGPSALTLSIATELVTLPAELVATTENCAPLSAMVVAGIEKLDEVAPAMGWPPRCHWNEIGPEPLAVTLKPAVCPSSMVTLCGCAVIVGAVAAGGGLPPGGEPPGAGAALLPPPPPPPPLHALSTETAKASATTPRSRMAPPPKSFSTSYEPASPYHRAEMQWIVCGAEIAVAFYLSVRNSRSEPAIRSG